MTSEGEMDERVFDSGGAEKRMEQHTSIDHVTNGPKKWLISVLGLLLAIAGFTGGMFWNSFQVGRWTQAMEDGVAANRSDNDSQNLQLQGIITSLQSMVIVDSVQNFQIRQNQRDLADIKQDLREHRVVSEQ